MTGPPNGKVPVQGGHRDSTTYQGDQLDQDLDLSLHRTAPVEHVTSLSGWAALVAWLGAVTS